MSTPAQERVANYDPDKAREVLTDAASVLEMLRARSRDLGDSRIVEDVIASAELGDAVDVMADAMGVGSEIDDWPVEGEAKCPSQSLSLS